MIWVRRGVGEGVADLREFVLDDRHDADARPQDVEVIGNLGRELRQFVADFVAPKGGQALQSQLEDGAGLRFRETVGAVVVDLVTRVVDQQDQRRDVLRRPVAAHQRFARGIRIRRGADEANDLVDIGDRDRQAAQHVGAFAGLVEQVFGAARDHFLAEIHEGLDQVLQRHQLGAPAVQRHHVGAEARLQRGVAVELVEHDIRHSVALDLDDDAHAVAIGFVAQIGDAFDLLFADELRDLLDQRRLVHLIGDLVDDDRFALLAHDLDLGFASHDDRAATRHVGRARAGTSEDHCAGREVRAGNQLDETFGRDIGVLDERQASVDDFAEIVRRHVGGHADRDSARAVDQKIREPGRQNDRLVFQLVVVGAEIDRVLVDILQKRHRRAGEAQLGVTHGCRGIAVDGAEIALPVYQQQSHGKILRHAHQRVVDRLVAVRVILTHHVTDDAGRFHVLLVGRIAALVHGVENAPVHGFQTVAGVGESAAHDHAHGVIEVGALHLVDDGNHLDVAGWLIAARAGIVRIGQGRSFSKRPAVRAARSATRPGKIAARRIGEQIRAVKPMKSTR